MWPAGLSAYATLYGSTREVDEAVASTLRGAGVDAEVKPAREVRKLEGYDAVVLGAPLITHKLQKEARGFLTRHRRALSGMPVALFALGPCKEPRDEEEWRDCSGQFEQALAELDWLKPVAAERYSQCVGCALRTERRCVVRTLQPTRQRAARRTHGHGLVGAALAAIRSV